MPVIRVAGALEEEKKNRKHFCDKIVAGRINWNDITVRKSEIILVVSININDVFYDSCDLLLEMLNWIWCSFICQNILNYACIQILKWLNC